MGECALNKQVREQRQATVLPSDPSNPRHSRTREGGIRAQQEPSPKSQSQRNERKKAVITGPGWMEGASLLLAVGAPRLATSPTRGNEDLL